MSATLTTPRDEQAPLAISVPPAAHLSSPGRAVPNERAGAGTNPPNTHGHSEGGSNQAGTPARPEGGSSQLGAQARSEGGSSQPELHASDPTARTPAATARHSTAGAENAAVARNHRAAWESLVDRVHGVLDDFDPQTPGHISDLRELRRQVERAERRLSALRLAVISHAERQGAAAASGHSDIAAWNAGVTRTYRSTAQSDAHTAGALFGGALNQGINDTPQAQHPGGESPEAPLNAANASGPNYCDPSGAAGVGGGGLSGPLDAGLLGQPGVPGLPGVPGQLGAPGVPGGAGQCPVRVGEATAKALQAGEISETHVRIITNALQQLPDRYTLSQRIQCEQELLKHAQLATPTGLRRTANRILSIIEPDPAVVDAHENTIAAQEEATALRNAKFWITDNHDGSMRGGFQVPTLAGHMLKKILEAMTSPRSTTARSTTARSRTAGSTATPPGTTQFGALGSTAHRSDQSSTTQPSAARPTAPISPKERYLERENLLGRAFADLLAHLPTDHLHTSNSATMLITVTLDQLRGALTTATTETGEHISAGTARRLACEAGIIPALMGTPSTPLDLGTRTRIFTSTQRAALATTYTQCAAHDCERPLAWCEIHHLKPWSHGGETNLANAVPLCGYHHRLIDNHPHGHTITTTNGTHHITFHRRT